jgi:hypothetical protein
MVAEGLPKWKTLFRRSIIVVGFEVNQKAKEKYFSTFKSYIPIKYIYVILQLAKRRRKSILRIKPPRRKFNGFQGCEAVCTGLQVPKSMKNDLPRLLWRQGVLALREVLYLRNYMVSHPKQCCLCIYVIRCKYLTYVSQRWHIINFVLFPYVSQKKSYNFNIFRSKLFPHSDVSLLWSPLSENICGLSLTRHSYKYGWPANFTKYI